MGGFEVVGVDLELDAVTAHLDAGVGTVEVHDDGFDAFAFEQPFGNLGFVFVVVLSYGFERSHNGFLLLLND